MENGYAARIEKAFNSCARLLGDVNKYRPDTGVILGSGLSEARKAVEGFDLKFSDIEGFPVSTVSGHSGVMRISSKCAIMAGRFHYYEGHTVDNVVLPVFLLHRLGVRNILITNAAGGINSLYSPGDLVLIKDHINMTGLNPLIGLNEGLPGPRFPDMSEAYDRKQMVKICDTFPDLKKGIYAGLKGPSYETPAEVEMLKRMGADLVGMSTVNEVIAARYLGIKVTGVSCVTNMASGISEDTLDHREVLETGKKAESRLTELVKYFISGI